MESYRVQLLAYQNPSHAPSKIDRVRISQTVKKNLKESNYNNETVADDVDITDRETTLNFSNKDFSAPKKNKPDDMKGLPLPENIEDEKISL
jgi:hypothetical protein